MDFEKIDVYERGFSQEIIGFVAPEPSLWIYGFFFKGWALENQYEKWI